MRDSEIKSTVHHKGSILYQVGDFIVPLYWITDRSDRRKDLCPQHAEILCIHSQAVREVEPVVKDLPDAGNIAAGEEADCCTYSGEEKNNEEHNPDELPSLFHALSSL